jgi:6-phosphofructokinase 2
LLRRLLKQEDLSAITVGVAADTRLDFTVFERQDAAQYRFVFPASPMTGREVTTLFEALEDVAPAPGYLVVSGSCPEDITGQFFDDAATMVYAARSSRSIRPGGALSIAVDRAAYLIKPNLREFEDLMGSGLRTDDLRVKAARDLLARSELELIAVTLGADGALLVSHNGAWRGMAPKIEPLSTVGAGDRFLGAFVSQLSKATPLKGALRFAIGVGSAALLAPSTKLCRPQDVEQLLPSVTVDEL